MLGLHDPGEDVSFFSAGPASITTDVVGDGEGGIFIVVEGAEACPIFACAFKRNRLTDEVNDSDTCSEFV